jgi:hypothetical protein
MKNNYFLVLLLMFTININSSDFVKSISSRLSLKTINGIAACGLCAVLGGSFYLYYDYKFNRKQREKEYCLKFLDNILNSSCSFDEELIRFKIVFNKKKCVCFKYEYGELFYSKNQAEEYRKNKNVIDANFLENDLEDSINSTLDIIVEEAEKEEFIKVIESKIYDYTKNYKYFKEAEEDIKKTTFYKIILSLFKENDKKEEEKNVNINDHFYFYEYSFNEDKLEYEFQEIKFISDNEFFKEKNTYYGSKYLKIYCEDSLNNKKQKKLFIDDLNTYIKTLIIKEKSPEEMRPEEMRPEEMRPEEMRYENFIKIKTFVFKEFIKKFIEKSKIEK